VRPHLEKNPSQKRAGGVAQGVGPEFNPSTTKKKKKKKKSGVCTGPRKTHFLSPKLKSP
jgi:hypothetical protein